MNKRMNESNWLTHYISKWNNRFDSIDNAKHTEPRLQSESIYFECEWQWRNRRSTAGAKVLCCSNSFWSRHHHRHRHRRQREQTISHRQDIRALRFTFCKYTNTLCSGWRAEAEPNECYWNVPHEKRTWPEVLFTLQNWSIQLAHRNICTRARCARSLAVLFFSLSFSFADLFCAILPLLICQIKCFYYCALHVYRSLFGCCCWRRRRRHVPFRAKLLAHWIFLLHRSISLFSSFHFSTRSCTPFFMNLFVFCQTSEVICKQVVVV